MTMGPAILLVAMAGGQPGPVSTLRELAPALTRCFQAPEGSAGSQITVLLSLTRSGAVLGKPRITYSHLVGRPEDQVAFAKAALGALAACTPVAVTLSLGEAIAGRPLSIRFVGGGPSRGI